MNRRRTRVVANLGKHQHHIEHDLCRRCDQNTKGRVRRGLRPWFLHALVACQSLETVSESIIADTTLSVPFVTTMFIGALMKAAGFLSKCRGRMPCRIHVLWRLCIACPKHGSKQLLRRPPDRKTPSRISTEMQDSVIVDHTYIQRPGGMIRSRVIIIDVKLTFILHCRCNTRNHDFATIHHSSPPCSANMLCHRLPGRCIDPCRSSPSFLQS